MADAPPSAPMDDDATAAGLIARLKASGICETVQHSESEWWLAITLGPTPAGQGHVVIDENEAKFYESL